MKFNLLYSFFLLAFALSILGNSGGRATIAGRGNTGAPGDQTNTTCRTCHSTSPTTAVSLAIDLLDDNNNSISSSGYQPGKAYTAQVEITASGGTPAAYGFQLIALNAAAGVNGSAISTWSEPDSHVKIATASFNGRTYAEHNNPNKDNNMFTVKWTAPAAGSGDITFYSCGNGVNLNNSTTGDAAACNSLTISENTTVASNDLHSEFEISIFPNPAYEVLSVRLATPNQQEYFLNILNASGQLMESREWQTFTGEHVEQLEISHLPAGLYFVQLLCQEVSFTKKFLKQ